MLPDLGKSAREMGGAEELFDLLDKGCLGGERGAGYDEGFAGGRREAREEVFGDGVTAVVEFLELGWLPEAAY